VTIHFAHSPRVALHSANELVTAAERPCPDSYHTAVHLFYVITVCWCIRKIRTTAQTHKNRLTAQFRSTLYDWPSVLFHCKMPMNSCKQHNRPIPIYIAPLSICPVSLHSVNEFVQAAQPPNSDLRCTIAPLSCFLTVCQ
jgi:hypothetical protein